MKPYHITLRHGRSRLCLTALARSSGEALCNALDALAAIDCACWSGSVRPA